MAEFKDEQTAPFWTPARRNWAAAAIVALYLAGVSGRWYLTPDSSKYLLLGQSLAAGEGYAIFDQPHGKFPPGLPLWIAGMKRIGLGDMLWLNLAMALAGLATLLVAYRLLLRLTTPGVAFSIVLAVALSYEMYGASFRQLSDVPFMLLALCGLWGYVAGGEGSRRRMFFGTAALAACCWIRVVGFPLALAAGVGLLLEHRRGGRAVAWGNAALLAAVLALSATWMIAQDRASRADGVTASYGSEMEILARRSSWERAAAPLVHLYQTGPEAFRLASGQKLPAALAAILLIAPVAVGMSRELFAGRWIAVLAVAGYIGGILLMRPLLARYLLPVAPLMYVHFVVGWSWIVARMTDSPLRWRRPATVALAVVVAMNLAKDFRLAAAVHGPDFESFREDWPEIYDAARTLRGRWDGGRRFVSTEYDTVLAYLSGVPCRQLDRRMLMTRPAGEEVRHYLAQARVDAVLVAKGTPRYPYYASLASAVGMETAPPLYENPRFALFAVSAESTAARLANRPEGKSAAVEPPSRSE